MINKCLACDGVNCINYFNEKGKILECMNCKAVYSEEPVNSRDTHIQKDSHSPTMLERITNKLTHERFWKILADEYVNYLKSKTNMNFKTAFDVGTYFGSFVSEMNKIGIDTWGIESDQRFVKLSVSKKVEWGYFDENYQPKMKYDLICLTQMLYYIRDNYTLLKHVKNMLSNNGLIFIATANPESSYLRNELKSIFAGPGTNMVLSRYNFELLENKLGLKLIDYTAYKANLFIDLYTSKNKKIDMAKYFLKLKKAYVPDPNGAHAFLLLQSI